MSDLGALSKDSVKALVATSPALRARERADLSSSLVGVCAGVDNSLRSFIDIRISSLVGALPVRLKTSTVMSATRMITGIAVKITTRIATVVIGQPTSQVANPIMPALAAKENPM